MHDEPTRILDAARVRARAQLRRCTMIARGTPVIVAGAEHPQSLPVIRGLGRAGARVTAGGNRPDCVGFRSRYATDAFRYRSPRDDLSGFIADIMHAAEHSGAQLVVPAAPAAFAALVAARSVVESRLRIAAAPPTALATALDVTRTFAIAREVGIATPRWCTGPSIPDILHAARDLTAPFVVRQRGRDGAFVLPEWSGFSDGGVRTAADLDELRRVLEPLWDYADCVLVHEAAPGVSHAVTGVWQRGRPVAMMAYERERGWARAGGVSVVRHSVRLDESLAAAVTQLFDAAQWHGVGTAELSYDRRANRYTLLGLSGRFHASTALCLAAGVNLPAHAVSVHLGAASPERSHYRVGVASRWLRGDVLATWDDVTRLRNAGMRHPVSRWRMLWNFLRDFARPMCYDEYARDDVVPALTTLVSLVTQSVRATGRGAAALARLVIGIPQPVAARRSGATGRMGYEV